MMQVLTLDTMRFTCRHCGRRLDAVLCRTTAQLQEKLPKRCCAGQPMDLVLTGPTRVE